jgi:hypothetical protein
MCYSLFIYLVGLYAYKFIGNLVKLPLVSSVSSSGSYPYILGLYLLFLKFYSFFKILSAIKFVLDAFSSISLSNFSAYDNNVITFLIYLASDKT